MTKNIGKRKAEKHENANTLPDTAEEKKAQEKHKRNV